MKFKIGDTVKTKRWSSNWCGIEGVVENLDNEWIKVRFVNVTLKNGSLIRNENHECYSYQLILICSECKKDDCVTLRMEKE